MREVGLARDGTEAGCGFGTRSSVASAGVLARGVLAPSCFNPLILRAIALLRREPGTGTPIDAAFVAGIARDLDLGEPRQPVV